MKQFLIGGFILAFLLGSVPAMAESDQRRGMLSSTSGVDKGKAGPQHKKFLTSRYRDDRGHHSDNKGGHRGGHKNRGHNRRDDGWRGHPGRYHGWKPGKGHHRGHGYRGHQRQWNKHGSRNHYRGRHQGTRYRFHYNSLVGPGGSSSFSGGQVTIDLSRR